MTSFGDKATPFFLGVASAITVTATGGVFGAATGGVFGGGTLTGCLHLCEHMCGAFPARRRGVLDLDLVGGRRRHIGGRHIVCRHAVEALSPDVRRGDLDR